MKKFEKKKKEKSKKIKEDKNNFDENKVVPLENVLPDIRYGREEHSSSRCCCKRERIS